MAVLVYRHCRWCYWRVRGIRSMAGIMESVDVMRADDWLTELLPDELKELRARMLSACRKSNVLYGSPPWDAALAFSRCVLLEYRDIFLAYELEQIGRRVLNDNA